MNQLLTGLNSTLSQFQDTSFSVLVINDGSTGKFTIKAASQFSVQVLHLQRNIGHQKAIAVGLAYIKENMECDKVLVKISVSKRPIRMVMLQLARSRLRFMMTARLLSTIPQLSIRLLAPYLAMF